MTSGYDLVRATLDGVTHAARKDIRGRVFSACGMWVGTAGIHWLGVLETTAPDVDCMSCLVVEGRPRAG